MSIVEFAIERINDTEKLVIYSAPPSTSVIEMNEDTLQMIEKYYENSLKFVDGISFNIDDVLFVSEGYTENIHKFRIFYDR